MQLKVQLSRFFRTVLREELRVSYSEDTNREKYLQFDRKTPNKRCAATTSLWHNMKTLEIYLFVNN